MLSLVFLILGCKAPRVYHATDSVVAAPEMKFQTAFIEFDDQGELWEPTQIKAAVEAIESLDRVFLITYIHGWKNDADFRNQNYQMFTNMLNALSARLDEKSFKVFGVFMAWRGDSVAFHDPVSWVARQLSFWSRTDAAERVAGTSATEALYSILKAANAKPGSKVILLGHSMGALILERALSQAMASQVLLPSAKASKSPADLVLLINSAASSIYARQFISLLSRVATEIPSTAPGKPEETVYSFERPLIISATSRGDWATGKVFPFGMWFSSLTKRFRVYHTNDVFTGKQATFYRTTAGNNKNLWSHDISRTNRVKRTQKTSPAVHDQTNQQTLQRNALRRNLAPTENPLVFEIEDSKYRSTYEISPLPEAKNRSPYWVVRVPKSIIHGHDDIFNPRFTAFVGALLRLTEVTEPSKQRPRLDRKAFVQSD